MPGVTTDYRLRLYQGGERLPLRATTRGGLVPDLAALLPADAEDRTVEYLEFVRLLWEANAELRRQYGRRARPASNEELAGAMNIHVRTLYKRRDAFEVDLAPYKRLIGPRPPRA